jgi:MFS family permease
VVVDPVGDLKLERRLYYGARFLAQIAQNLMLAALLVIAGTSSHAALGLSSLLIANIIPAIAFGVLGGAASDRIGASRGFMLGSLLRLLTVTAALIFMHGPAMVWAVAFCYSAVSQLSTPSEMALVRTVRHGSSAPVHSWLVAVQYAGQGLGMLILAPALYIAGGTNAMLFGSVIGFFILVATTALLSSRLRATPAGHLQPAREAFSFRNTVGFFRRQPLARDAVTVLAVKSMVTQGIVVALPLYMKHDMGLGHTATAMLLVPGIIGTIAGLLWAGPTITRARAAAAMRLSLLAMTVSVFALAALDFGITAVVQFTEVPPVTHFEASLNTTYLVAFPVAFLLGLALSGAMVSARVALTETAPVDQQARVYAVQSTLTDALVVLPLLLLGVGAQLAGARMTLAAIGIFATLAFLAIERPTIPDRFRWRPQAEPALIPILIDDDPLP